MSFARSQIALKIYLKMCTKIQIRYPKQIDGEVTEKPIAFAAQPQYNIAWIACPYTIAPQHALSIMLSPMPLLHFTHKHLSQPLQNWIYKHQYLHVDPSMHAKSSSRPHAAPSLPTSNYNHLGRTCVHGKTENSFTSTNNIDDPTSLHAHNKKKTIKNGHLAVMAQKPKVKTVGQ